MSGFRQDALNNFYDQKYREAFANEFLNVWIATQIRTLREQRQWTQGVLAQRAGMKQSRISALENADYSSWSVNTLKRLAKAFDVTLVVEFRSYGDRLEDFERFERRDMSAVSFSEDPIFHPKPLENMSLPISAAEMTRGLSSQVSGSAQEIGISTFGTTRMTVAYSGADQTIADALVVTQRKTPAPDAGTTRFFLGMLASFRELEQSNPQESERSVPV